jgi:catechol 2,3-dioxygenase-like lactoylglutathione lyase family enzyme
MNNEQAKLVKHLRLPPVRQIGIVVRDLDRTIRYYAENFGIGPWFRTDFGEEEHLWRGTEKITYTVDVALEFSGKTQIELISPREGDRNIHQEHLDTYGEGLHHLGFFVKNIDTRLRLVKESGIGVLQSGFLKSAGKAGGSVTSYAYLDTRDTGGVILELIQTKFVGVSIVMSRPWFEIGALTGDLEKIKV